MIKIQLSDFCFLSLRGERFKIQMSSVKFSDDGKFRYAVTNHQHSRIWKPSFHTGWESMSNVEQWDFNNPIEFRYKGTPAPKEFQGDFYLTSENGVIYINFPKGFKWRIPTKTDKMEYIDDALHVGKHYACYYKWEDEISVDGDGENLVFQHKGKKITVPKEAYSWSSLKLLKKILK